MKMKLSISHLIAISLFYSLLGVVRGSVASAGQCPNNDMELMLDGLQQGVMLLNPNISVIGTLENKMETQKLHDRNQDLNLQNIELVVNGRMEGATNIMKEFNQRLDELLKKYSNVVISQEMLNQRINALVKPTLRRSCIDVMETETFDGIYRISMLEYGPEPVDVYCMDQVQYGKGWTVVLRRKNDTIDFNRTWSDYKRGFGNLDGDFFIGLDKLHAMTSDDDSPQELLIRFRVSNSEEISYAKYSEFRIGNEEGGFVLEQIGNHTGNAQDALTDLRGMKFSTLDRDNDLGNFKNCAKYHFGGWWYKNCGNSVLTGKFRNGIYWAHLKKNVDYAIYAEMSIRALEN